MKKAFLLTFSLVLTSLFAQAQCDYFNGDLENWQVFPFEIAGQTRDIETPENHVSYNRFFVNYFYVEFFGDPVATDLWLNNTPLFWGIEKSTDASTGQYAAKLIAEPNIPFADLYTNYACNSIHSTLKVDIKHVGNTSDTLVINGVYDANLPSLPIADPTGLDTVAAYYLDAVIMNETTDYVTLTLPVQIADANAPVDSFSLVFFTTAIQGGYFLIDNIRFEDSTLDGDGDGFAANVDCDDTNAAVNPGATEICNQIDDNCDTQTDEGVTSAFYYDGDGDGFGTEANPVQACTAPDDYVTNDTDCNDASATVFPGATEVANNGIDEDCDGEDFISGTDELAELNLQVSPNPFTTTLRIENLPATGFKVKLVNAFGQTLLDNNGKAQLDVSRLSAGVYYLQIMEQSTAKRKVVLVVKQ